MMPPSDAFYLAAEPGEDRLNLERALDALRYLGMSPTKSDLKEELEKLRRDPTTYNQPLDELLAAPITLEEFETLSRVLQRAKLTARGLIGCFKTFDPAERGFLAAADLRELATTLGDPLTDKEADSLLALAEQCGASEGRVDYTRLAEVLVDGTNVSSSGTHNCE